MLPLQITDVALEQRPHHILDMVHLSQAEALGWLEVGQQV
jgi:hypothetical protein